MKGKLTTLLLAICLLPGLFCSPLAAQTRNISVKGTVTDTKGEPLVGVMVYVQGSTSNGSLTGADGKYSLSGVSSKATIIASFMGYEEVHEAVDGRNVIDFVLKEDSELLDEAVAIGYGNQRKLTLTGSVATTSGSEPCSRRMPLEVSSPAAVRMRVRAAPPVTVFSFTQEAKAFFPMVFTFLPMLTVFSFFMPLKALALMAVTL